MENWIDISLLLCDFIFLVEEEYKINQNNLSKSNLFVKRDNRIECIEKIIRNSGRR